MSSEAGAQTQDKHPGSQSRSPCLGPPPVPTLNFKTAVTCVATSAQSTPRLGEPESQGELSMVVGAHCFFPQLTNSPPPPPPPGRWLWQGSWAQGMPGELRQVPQSHLLRLPLQAQPEHCGWLSAWWGRRCFLSSSCWHYCGQSQSRPPWGVLGPNTP